jgi:hypothetical protein
MERKTIDIIKQKRSVSEAARQNHKEYLRLRKLIRQTLIEGPATIPGMAQKTGLPADQVLFVVMTMRKFDEVEAGDPDDLEEYFYYKLKEK